MTSNIINKMQMDNLFCLPAAYFLLAYKFHVIYYLNIALLGSICNMFASHAIWGKQSCEIVHDRQNRMSNCEYNLLTKEQFLFPISHK